MSAENIKLENLIIEGFNRANKKLIETSAANNEIMVISVNGEAQHVSAKDLLAKMNSPK
jgi:hypothetical protein